jgi:hypothetical protein
MSGLEHLSRERVDPHADALSRELVQPAAHTRKLPPRRSGETPNLEWRP